MFAYIHSFPVYFTVADRPFRFDYFDPKCSFEKVGIPNEKRTVSTTDNTFQVGVAKEILWERLFFILSLRGLLPLGNLCDTIRYDGEKVTCTNEYSKIHEFGFNKCYYFGDPNTSGIAIEHNLEESRYICYDYIAFHKGGKHEIDYISTDDDFVGEIWFYSSDRIDGNTGVKDACIVSILTESQLLDPGYSETMARFKMEKVLYDNGMKGPLNGYTSTGRPRHYRFKTSHITRTKALKNSGQWELLPRIYDSPLDDVEMLSMVLEKDLAQYEALRCDYTLPA